MTSIFFWCSIFEIWLFGMAFFVFCFHPLEMAIIWAYFLHLIKGVLGLIMSFLFAPTSYDMIGHISDFPEGQHMSFEQLGDHINQGFKDYLKL